MVRDRWRVNEVYQIILIKILLCKRLLKLFIYPFQSVRFLFLEAIRYVEFSKRCHLRVQISVPYYQLLILNLYVVI